MILVTRPAPEGEILCQQLNDQGYQTLWLPTLSFAPPGDPEAAQRALKTPNAYDWLIFISPQSVRFGMPYLSDHLPVRCQIGAMGAATARQLQSAGLTVNAYPDTSPSAEALLALPCFQSITGQQIAIIKGQGGRKRLTQVLSARGAHVTEISVYQRLRPAPENRAAFQTPIQQHKISATVITSGKGLLNLLKLLGKDIYSPLLYTPLVVVSPRLARLARRLGFQQILVAANPGGDAIMAALNDHQQDRETRMTLQDDSASPEQKPVPKPSRLSLKFFLLFFVVCLCAASLYFLYRQHHHQQLQQQRQQLEAADNTHLLLTDLNNAVKEDQAALTALSEKQADTTEQLKKIQQTLPAPDPTLAARYTALSALDALLDNLTPDNIRAAQTPDTPATTEEVHSAWQRAGSILKQVWQQLVTIHHAGDEHQALSPTATQLVILRLHSDVSAAQWAVLHHEPAIYKAALENVRRTLQRSFSEETAKEAQDRLAELDDAPTTIDKPVNAD